MAPIARLVIAKRNLSACSGKSSANAVEKFELADIIVDGDRAATRIDVTLRNPETDTPVEGQNAIF